MANGKQVQERVEVAYVIPTGRGMRFTPKRRVVARNRLAKVVDDLLERGARDFAYRVVGS